MIGRLLDPLARGMMEGPAVDFVRPASEAALVGLDSVSWRVFRNPVSLFVGGVTAVILELAEPRVRSGVWEHSSFRTDPVGRLRRTGMAAMVTVYGARRQAEAMIAGVRRGHEGVTGVTPGGEAYRADDPELLRWVQATAVWGFATAYARFVQRLSAAERSAMFAEGVAAARLYGVEGPPASWAEWEALLAATEGRLERSPIVEEFLTLMEDAPAFPRALRPAQRLMVRGAVSIVPDRVRERLALRGRLRPGEAAVLRALGAAAERVDLPSSPPSGALRRLGLPPGHLNPLLRQR